MEYTKLKTTTSDEIIVRINDDETITFIPIDPANSDYQAYLKSLEDEANTL